MSEERLADQIVRIDELNAELDRAGDAFRVLRSIEMDVLRRRRPRDMDPEALAPLDLVLGAFHSKLRIREDQTERYLAALRNPSDPRARPPEGAHVRTSRRPPAPTGPAYSPRRRVWGRRSSSTRRRRGRTSTWSSRGSRWRRGCEWFSIGSDAHAADELAFLPFGLATAALAGIPRERILNYRTADEVVAWASELRERSI